MRCVSRDDQDLTRLEACFPTIDDRVAVAIDTEHQVILARAGSRAEAYELYDMGIDHVYRDKLDSSLQLGVQALRLLGFRAHQAHRAAQKFRRHDEHAVRELAEMRRQATNDRKGLLARLLGKKE